MDITDNGEWKDARLSAKVTETAENTRTIMAESSDLVIKYGKIAETAVSVIMCEGLASTDTVAELIYRPLNLLRESFGGERQPQQNEQSEDGKTLKDKLLSQELLFPQKKGENPSGNGAKKSAQAAGNKQEPPVCNRLFTEFSDGIFLAAEQKEVQTYGELCRLIMSGFVIVQVEGIDCALAIGVQGYKSRSVSEPTSHINLRGSQESFIEVIRTNISLIRRRIKSPELVFKMSTIGTRSHTDVCVCYIRGVADERLVEDVEQRLKAVPLDTILEGGYIQPFLEQQRSLAFSEIGSTERPDTLAAKLGEGRIGILVDGTPYAMYLPHLFTEYFQTMDDYTARPTYGTIIRWLRYISYFVAVVLPGFYVAVTAFHPELLPNSLLLSLYSSELVTPYPVFVECIIILIFYEIMREAGLRMPKAVGHAVSIVGGLVIGDIVVTAGLVSAPIILVVALSAICGFVVPDLYQSIIFFRLIFVLAAGIWGLPGLMLLGFVLLIKISSMSIYGIPYTAPVSPFTPRAMRDVLVRASWRTLSKRSAKIQKLDGVNIDER